MKLAEGVWMGFSEIRAHKMRSFLSFFGITIGIASVLLTISILSGAKRQMEEGMRLSGYGRLEVRRKWEGYSSRRSVSKGVTMDDADSIAAHYPELLILPEMRSRQMNIGYKDFRTVAAVIGVTPRYRERNWVHELRGRFINENDMTNFRRVCVLIKKGAPSKKSFWRKFWKRKDRFEEFYALYDPLGKAIRIGDHLFTVIGIAQEPPEDDDPRWFRRHRGNVVGWVPLTAFQKHIRNTEAVSTLAVDTGSPDTTDYYSSAITALLKIRHRGEEDFEVLDFSQLMAGALQRMKNFQLVFGLIAVIALIAGGIGIMNVSLATVFSRIHEIGIRKAVGATSLDILIQFVMETVVLSSAGGVFGVLLGIGGATLLPSISPRFDIHVPILGTLLCLVISVGVGMVFSIYPAFQASRLDPVEALRYE